MKRLKLKISFSTQKKVLRKRKKFWTYKTNQWLRDLILICLNLILNGKLNMKVELSILAHKFQLITLKYYKYLKMICTFYKVFNCMKIWIKLPVPLLMKMVKPQKKMKLSFLTSPLSITRSKSHRNTGKFNALISLKWMIVEYGFNRVSRCISNTHFNTKTVWFVIGTFTRFRITNWYRIWIKTL